MTACLVREAARIELITLNRPLQRRKGATLEPSLPPVHPKFARIAHLSTYVCVCELYHAPVRVTVHFAPPPAKDLSEIGSDGVHRLCTIGMRTSGCGVSGLLLLFSTY